MTEIQVMRRAAGTAKKPIERINNLHGLRILAALFVIYYHTGYRLAGMNSFGGFSVPIFFIISGFVMAMIATEQPKDFLKRRLLRALPTYWIATIIIFSISLAFPEIFHSTRPHLVWLIKSLLFIPFAKAPGIIQPVIFVGWTMNCEIILYLLVALGLRFTKRPVFFASIAMLTFMAGCSLFADVSAVAFFYSRSTMLSFVLGLIAYPAWKKLSVQTAVWFRWIACGTLAATLVTLCALEGLMIDPYLSADGMFSLRPVIPHLGALVIVLAALLLARAGHDLQGDKLIVIAESTYVLYLMHAYLLLAFTKLAVRLPAQFAMNRSVGLILVMGCSVAMAVAVHLYIERPAMSFLKSRSTNPRSRIVPSISAEAAVEVSPVGLFSSAQLAD